MGVNGVPCESMFFFLQDGALPVLRLRPVAMPGRHYCVFSFSENVYRASIEKRKRSLCPSDFKIVGELGIIRFTPQGKLTVKGATDLLQEAVEHPDFEPGFGSLWDLRAADVRGFTTEDMQEMHSFNKSILPQRGAARSAFVAGNDVSFGVARVYEVIAENPNVARHVFRNVADAEAWLTETTPPR
jgi:hypothetical protein